eukprot:scaffold175_cov177-Amphora_coffeaeformis.AAC.7
MSAAANARKAYRDLYHILRQMPAKDQPKQLKELRTRFREPLAPSESVEDRIRKAKDRASFLRITTVKTKPRGEAGRWIYKDGQRLHADEHSGTLRDGNGKVISNWDGKNLDPESVTRHRKQLNRAGGVLKTTTRRGIAGLFLAAKGELDIILDSDDDLSFRMDIGTIWRRLNSRRRQTTSDDLFFTNKRSNTTP